MTSIQQLKLIANENRRRIVEMVHAAGVGHIGGSLSVIDILTAIYETDIDFSTWPRARMVLSKGHATPALYAALTQKGIVSEEEYPTFRQINSRLQGHPYTCDMPETDATTGLLGQGFSIACGMAVAKRAMDDAHFVYAICGDSEAAEGQLWEALMFAGHQQLSNLIFVFDCNGLGSHDPLPQIIDIEPLVDKLIAFRLHVIEIDGHNMESIVNALERARASGLPTAIVARTVKGKGVSFMEGNGAWHSRGLTDDEYERALKELAAERRSIA